MSNYIPGAGGLFSGNVSELFGSRIALWGMTVKKNVDMNCGVHVYVVSNSVESFCLVKHGRRASHPGINLDS